MVALYMVLALLASVLLLTLVLDNLKLVNQRVCHSKQLNQSDKLNPTFLLLVIQLMDRSTGLLIACKEI